MRLTEPLRTFAATVAVAAETQPGVVLLGQSLATPWLARKVGTVQPAAARARLLPRGLGEILVNRKKKQPEAGPARQIMIHRVCTPRSWKTIRSTPLGDLDPVIRLFEGNFFKSLK